MHTKLSAKPNRVVATALAGLLAVTAAYAKDEGAAREVRIAAIPLALHTTVASEKLTLTGDTLALEAARGTDLFVSPDGKDAKDDTARALFQPQGDFILSARVASGFGKPYDGAALLVYLDATHWAKLLFEKTKGAAPGFVTSTVAKGTGDDAYHARVDADSVWLKVARRGDMVVFYSSADGKAWQMVRTVGFPATQPLRVGFSAQSPDSDRYTARFSEIRYRPVAFKDYWQGE